MPDHRTGWLAANPWFADSVLAVLLLLVTTIGFISDAASFGSSYLLTLPTTVAYACAFGMSAAVAGARSFPVPAAAVVGALAVVFILASGTPYLAGAAVPYALYAVAWRSGSRSTSFFGLALGLGGCAFAAARWAGDGTLEIVAGLAVPQFLVVFGLTGLVVTGSWLIGDRRRSADALLRSYAERAALLEQESRQQSMLGAAEERRRIARDLHDVIAHSLTVMTVQADGARAAIDRNPERAAEALDQIGRTGREALRETRALLGVLRDETNRSGRTPQPTVEDLHRLVADSGPPATLVVAGAVRPLLAAVELTAYRVTQESLTNISRHAGTPGLVEVRLEHHPHSLELTVTDDGRGAGAVNDGHGSGIQGMTERVAGVGGTLRAAPRPGGGFVVRALFPEPYAAAPAAPPATRAEQTTTVDAP